MKLIIKPLKLLAGLLFFYPLIYTVVTMLPDGIQRQTMQFVALLALVENISYTLKYRKCNHLIYLCVIFFMVAYNMIAHGISYVLHLDFYGFISFLLIGGLCRDNRLLEQLSKYLNNERMLKRLLSLYYLAILLSVFLKNGLRIDMVSSSAWGIAMPILYGPFSFPHGLSYVQISMFAIAHLAYDKTRKKLYIFFMVLSGICCFWTGVRSGLLAFAVMIMYWYMNFTNYRTKGMVVAIGGFVVVCLAIFTDILYNNPVVAKTMHALQSGSISNGREVFNAYLLNHYSQNMTAIQRIMGIGMEALRDTMSLRWNTDIHAHNDFINSLVGFGVLGLGMFLSTLISAGNKAKMRLPILMILIILAATNGLYMYTMTAFYIPVLVLYYRKMYEKKHKLAVI